MLLMHTYSVALGQSLQNLVPPQPSGTPPHAGLPSMAQVLTAHGGPHLPLALHTSGGVQKPQLTVPPQALVMSPHSRPAAMHSVGASFGWQRLGWPCAPHA